MSSARPKSVAIIGGGPSGLILALALKERGLTPTVYEQRSDSYALGGGIMLSPNALRVLDSIGGNPGDSNTVYQRVLPHGYSFDELAFVNEQHEQKNVYYFGHKKLYGYHALRVYRSVVIDALVGLAREMGIPVHYERPFSHIISEDAEAGVKFAMTTGEQLQADLLIGADGINSTVRQYIYPEVVPKYAGILAVSSAVPTSAIRYPKPDYPHTVTVQGAKGAYVMAPQTHDGGELFAGQARPHPVLDENELKELRHDKQKLLGLLRANKDDWNDVVQSAMEAARPETLNVWPFHIIPRLERWRSQGNRIIIIGDAAHAIPPSAGQGVNQAFEDAYALALLLSRDKLDFEQGLESWQSWRQDRVDKVLQLNAQMDRMRLPDSERAKLPEAPSGKEGDLAWLYSASIDEVVDTWV